MKKALIFSGISLAMFGLATSCSNENEMPAADGNVHFKVALPASMRTRSLSDGTTATTLTYAVYESGTKKAIIVSEDEVTFDPTTLTAQVNLQLVNGKSYDLIFWADAANNDAYTFDATTQEVTINYENLKGNDESRDAFFAARSFNVSGPINETIELYRPFAQINLGTDDLNTATAQNAYSDGLEVELKTTAFSTLNLFTGVASDKVNVDFKAAPITQLAAESFPYNPSTSEANPYTYIAMDYILVEAQKDILQVEYTFYNGSVANSQTLTVSQLPVQRNYRTNIFGSLLTSPTNFNVVIRPAFEEPDNDYTVTRENR